MSDYDDDLDPVPCCGGSRRVGIPNYNNRILIPIIEEILPNGSEAWRLVAAAYKEKSREANLRSEDDLKRNWVRKLCNNMKKPTGRSGADPNDRTNRCIEVQRKILDKTASGILGASSDDDNRFAPSSLSLSLSSSSDGEVGPGTELQVSPVHFQSNDDVESTDGNEATANAEATDVAESSANICAITEGSTEDTTPDVEVAFATSTHSRPSSVARRLSPRSSSSMSTSAPPIPQPQKVQSSRTSKTNKTKNSTNRERGLVTKSIERIASSIESGSGEDMRMMLEMRKMEWEEAEERRERYQRRGSMLVSVQFPWLATWHPWWGGGLNSGFKGPQQLTLDRPKSQKVLCYHTTDHIPLYKAVII